METKDKYTIRCMDGMGNWITDGCWNDGSQGCIDFETEREARESVAHLQGLYPDAKFQVFEIGQVPDAD